MDKLARILVVEDEDSVRRLILAALKDEGHLVTACSRGEQGLEHLRAEDHDLLVLDLHMPGMSGWDVLEAMRAQDLRDGVRVIILTAQSQERDILRGWRMGVDHYCMKPFEPDAFLSVVAHVLTASAERLSRDRQEELQRTQLLHLVDTVFER